MGLMLRKRNGTEKNALSFNLFIIITSILFTSLWTVKHFCVYIVFVIKVQALTCIAFITAGTNLWCICKCRPLIVLYFLVQAPKFVLHLQVQALNCIAFASAGTCLYCICKMQAPIVFLGTGTCLCCICKCKHLLYLQQQAPVYVAFLSAGPIVLLGTGTCLCCIRQCMHLLVLCL